MRIFIVVGMPAAGKNVARLYAEARGFPYFATGDLVRAEVRRRGLAPDAANVAAVSTELRGDDGLGVTRQALATARATGQPVVFLEGMRSWPEIELVRAGAEVVVVAFLAPRDVRRARVVARGRADDSAAAFDARDQRELAYGAAIPVALADAYVLNTGTLEQALQALATLVESRR
jgi:dephospho-CoA kinase